MAHYVRVPRESANDESYDVVEVYFADGDQVRPGSLIASLEGSKAVFEVEAGASGYIRYATTVGSKVGVGAFLAQISENAADPLSLPAASSEETSHEISGQRSMAGPQFTRKARELLDAARLDESFFSELDLVTAADVEAVVHASANRGDQFDSCATGVERLAIIGAGRACVQVIDMVLKSAHQIPVRLYDDIKFDSQFKLAGLSIAGKIDTARIADDFREGLFDKLVISFSDISARRRIFDALDAQGVPFANVIHPLASCGTGITMGTGNVICSFVSLGPLARIGNNNFISAHCNVEHHCNFGSHNTFGPGVVFSGGVQLGSCNRFGTGIFVEPHLSIGDDTVISSGSIILRNVPAGTIVKSQLRNVVRRQDE